MCKVGGCASSYQLGSCYSTTLVFDQGENGRCFVPDGSAHVRGDVWGEVIGLTSASDCKPDIRNRHSCQGFCQRVTS